MKIKYYIIGLFVSSVMWQACTDEPIPTSQDLIQIPYNPEPYVVQIPQGFPQLEVPSDNPMTKEGVELGRRLFYDPILSLDSTVSCASCHFPSLAFTDGSKLSTGVNNAIGRRNAMSLVNVGFYYSGLFWDGRVGSLEEQSLHPIEDPVELNLDLDVLIERLQAHADYAPRFRKAFGIEDRSQIDRTLISKALAQFERIIVAGNSKFDQFERGETVLSDDEALGYSMFFDFDDGLKDGECSHCHSVSLFTANTYHNNGLDSVGSDYTLFNDIGLGINGIVGDTGKFRTPTLRNIALTAPYMHDGRFNTLDEVMDHYNSGVKDSRNKDPLVANLNINEEQRNAIVAFMKTLTDTSYLLIPEVNSPF